MLTDVSISPQAPRRAAELDALPGLALLADDGADPLQLAGHPGVGGDDLVEGVGDLALEAGPVAGQPHREVAVAHGLQRAQELRHLGGRRGEDVGGSAVRLVGVMARSVRGMLSTPSCSRC